MKTKITRLSRRGISALLSVLMVMSGLSFALLSTSAAESSGGTVSASADSGSAVSASANDDGTVAAVAEDDGTVAASTDSGTVAATETSEEVGSGETVYLLGAINNSKPSDLTQVSSLSTTVGSDGKATFTIPQTYFSSSASYYFAISSSNSYKSCYWQTESYQTGVVTVSATGSAFSGAKENEYGLRADETGNDRWLDWHYAHVYVNASKLGGGVTLTVDTNAKSYTFTADDATIGEYTVTATVADGQSDYGSVTPTSNTIKYGESAITFTAKANTGYTFKEWSLSGTHAGDLTLSTNGAVAYITAKATTGGTATLTATFEEDSSYTPPTTGDDIYTAVSGVNNVTGEDIYTGVKATFYDYYTDGEISDDTWGFLDNSKITTKDYEPYETLNTALRDYAKSNSVTYPLYFGNFWIQNGTTYQPNNYAGSNNSTNYNFWAAVNNSNPLYSTSHSLTGLTGTTLGSNGEIYYYKNGAENENGEEMTLFNTAWLTNGTANGSGSALASVVSSDFPVRKTNVGGETTVDRSKIYVDTTQSSWWNNDSTKTGVYFFTSSGNDWAPEIYQGSGVWEFTVPEGYETATMIIVRLSSDATEGTWDKKIDKNQTDDISYNANYNLYTLGSNNNNPGYTAGVKSGTTTTTGGHNYYTYDSTDGTDNAYFTYNSSSQNITMNYGYGSSYSVRGHNVEYDTIKTLGFFPFETGRNKDAGNNSEWWANDYGFGVKFEIDFTLGMDGKTSDGEAQIFEYSGDDDMWVFVDGKLVLDLGGDHTASTGSINFATGDVTAAQTQGANATTTSGSTNATRNSNLSAVLGSDYNQNTNEVHTLTVYYMERGMFESNLKIGFSFEPVGNEFDVTNTVDTTQVNSGLVSAVESAINSSSSFTYAITPTNDAASYAYTDSTTTNGSGTGTSPSVKGTSANVVYVDQFTKGDSMTVTQSNTGGYAFTTTNSVNDIETGESITTTDGSTTGTGTFTFLTTKENPGDLDVTHLSADYVNEVQVGSLTVGKEITNYGDANTEFTLCFEIKLPDTANYQVYSDVTYVKSDGTTGTLGEDGTFTLKCYETATFYGIPLNSYVKVYEKNNDSVNVLYAFDGYVASDDLTNRADVSSDDNGNNNGVSAKLTGSTNTLTIENRRRTYRVEYLVPTRLYGQVGTNYWTVGDDGDMDYENCKVYAFTGYVDDTNFTYGEYNINGASEGDKAYGVNFSSGDNGGKTNLIVNMLPYEDVFDQTITWDEDNIEQYLYNAGNASETTYDVVASWVPSIEEFDRYVNAVVSVNGTTLNFFGESATDSCNKQCTYGTLLASTNESTMTGLKDTNGDNISSDLITSSKITDAVGDYTTDDTAYFITAPAKDTNGDSFLYWKVEKMDDSGANTNKEVTRCYTQRFAYTMYDNYYITAVYGEKSDSTSQSNYGSASAYIIDITRSQWNDTVNHADDENQSYSSASTSYDRVYIDFELAYNYQGIQLNEYTGNDKISVGFEIYASNGSSAKLWTKVATQEISLSKLDNKNRIEYYYGLKNTSAKAGYKYAIVPYISVNGYVVNYNSLNKTGNEDFDLTSCDGYTTVFDTFGGTNSPFANICNAAAGTMPAYSNIAGDNQIANDPTIKDKADSAQS